MNDVAMNAPILITGAGGGLGKSIAAMLRSKGFTNLLMPLRDELNLLNGEAVYRYFSENKPKIVLHLASVVFGLLGNQQNQLRSAVENTQINLNLFSAINEFPVRYVFFAGTVAGYAFPYKQIPLQEVDFFNGLPHGGEFGYAMSKRHAYSLLKILADTKSVKFTYGIFTNLYGEYDRFNDSSGHVIPSLIMKAHRATQLGETFQVWGDGSAQRDFLHFKDAADAVALCMFNDGDIPLINISSGIAVSICELATLIAHAAGLKDIKFLTEKPVGISSRVVSNNRLMALGFSQSINLSEGIRGLYDWYSKNVSRVRT